MNLITPAQHREQHFLYMHGTTLRAEDRHVAVCIDVGDFHQASGRRVTVITIDKRMPVRASGRGLSFISAQSMEISQTVSPKLSAGDDSSEVPVSLPPPYLRIRRRLPRM